MSTTVQHTTPLNTEECCNCSILFAIPANFQERRRDDGGTFYCPSGHPQLYSESTVKVLRGQLEEAQRKLSASKCETASERATRERVEAELKRHKKRSKNGVCPCCHRTFQNVQRHMRTKHPKYAEPSP